MSVIRKQLSTYAKGYGVTKEKIKNEPELLSFRKGGNRIAWTLLFTLVTSYGGETPPSEFTTETVMLH